MTFWAIVGWWLGFVFGLSVVAVLIAEVVERLVGVDERDVARSGRWVRRMAKVVDVLRGAWILGLAWTFAVFLMIGLGLGDQTPTAGDRVNLLWADALVFLAWVVALIVRTGVSARHWERINAVTQK